MSEETSEHLTAAIEQLSDDINGLMQVVEEGTLLSQLVEEIKVLREAIDDLRNEVEWALRNVFQNGEPRPLPRPITSMPVDPCDPAFGEKLNTVSRHEVPADDEPMFDDDAEYFREDEDDPLDEEEEGLEVEEGAEGVDAEEGIEERDDGTKPVDALPSAPMSSDAPEAPPPRRAVPSRQSAEAEPTRPQSPPINKPQKPLNGQAPPLPSPPASPPPRTASPARPPATARPTRQALLTRLYLHRHMTDLVRLVGHEELLAEDFQYMVRPLFEVHGEETVKRAIDELVSFSHRKKVTYARLKPEVVRLSVQLIGRPKSEG